MARRKTQEKAFRINTATHLEKSAVWSFESLVIHFGFFRQRFGQKRLSSCGRVRIGGASVREKVRRKTIPVLVLQWCYASDFFVPFGTSQRYQPIR
jgi:hypothetical protein